MIVGNALLQVLYMGLDLYKWIVIIHIILGWLVHFGVVNTHQPFVAAVGRFLFALTEPALRQVRRFVPNMGGIDISPIILFFIIFFLQAVIVNIMRSGL